MRVAGRSSTGGGVIRLRIARNKLRRRLRGVNLAEVMGVAVEAREEEDMDTEGPRISHRRLILR